MIRQLYCINQSRSVQEYVDQFCELVDQLKAYSKDTNPLYYTTRFIDRLHDDIKSVILVQRPPDLDTACCLALLQEETAVATPKFFKRIDTNFSPRPSSGALPLPRPPMYPKQDIISNDKSNTKVQTICGGKGDSISSL
jgi:hypothetical protein